MTITKRANLSGWGRYPKINAEQAHPRSVMDTQKLVESPNSAPMIARGLGRSYGDSALADCVVELTALDDFLEFDTEKGVLTCFAGVSLAVILRVFVPRGWFLPVTPGTQFVTVGGVVAGDVHGKNHHLDGCFSAYVDALEVATVSDGLVRCSREERKDLFHATCGGLGLTGVIVSVRLRLRRIVGAYIRQTTVKTRTLAETLECFEQYREARYSVAWIDCLAGGPALGRSLLMLGEHEEDGDCVVGQSGRLGIPFDLPAATLNPYSVRAFNTLYYHRVTRVRSERRVHYAPFFYPLDGVRDWNRMYGSQGMTAILQRIAASRRGSFLSVLKAFGEENENDLSFPMRGYTLALDFKFDAALLPLLDTLDRMVLDYGGRVYLVKDARMSEATFKRSYPRWEAFLAVRQRYGAHERLHSLQSQRLGL